MRRVAPWAAVGSVAFWLWQTRRALAASAGNAASGASAAGAATARLGRFDEAPPADPSGSPGAPDLEGADARQAAPNDDVSEPLDADDGRTPTVTAILPRAREGGSTAAERRPRKRARRDIVAAYAAVVPGVPWVNQVALAVHLDRPGELRRIAAEMRHAGDDIEAGLLANYTLLLERATDRSRVSGELLRMLRAAAARRSSTVASLSSWAASAARRGGEQSDADGSVPLVPSPVVPVEVEPGAEDERLSALAVRLRQASGTRS